MTFQDFFELKTLVEGKYVRTKYDKARFIDKQAEQAAKSIEHLQPPPQSEWSDISSKIFRLLQAEEDDINFEAQEVEFLKRDFSRNPNLVVRERNSSIILECSLRHKMPEKESKQPPKIKISLETEDSEEAKSPDRKKLA